jgi:hypothetical protein
VRRSSSGTACELRVGRECALLDDDHWPWRPTHRGCRRWSLHHERCVSSGGERLQKKALLAIEAVARALARRGVEAHIGDAVEPSLALLIEIGVVP